MMTPSREPTATSMWAAAFRPLRRQWRVRGLTIVRRLDLRPGELVRSAPGQDFLSQALRDPLARPALIDALRHARPGCLTCCCRGDQPERRMKAALLEAFRRRELLVIG